MIGARVGGSLAISPETSVSVGLNTSFLTNTNPDSFVVPGSDRFISIVDVGLATVIGPRTLLNLSAQFGITGHTPDLRLTASLPVRF